MRAHARFLLAFVLLAGTALFLQARSRSEVLPQRPPLSSFPDRLETGPAMTSKSRKTHSPCSGPVFSATRVPQRRSDPALRRSFHRLFPVPARRDTIHSPKNCLPGAGWSPI